MDQPVTIRPEVEAEITGWPNDTAAELAARLQRISAFEPLNAIEARAATGPRKRLQLLQMPR